MKKYIIAGNSVINLEYVVRFVCEPKGEIAVYCADGSKCRIYGGTYRGKALCDKVMKEWLDFLDNDEKYFYGENDLA